MQGRFPESGHSGAPVTFELWQWSPKPDQRRLLVKLHDGMRVPASSLTVSGVQFQFRIAALHDSVRCSALSSDAFDRSEWGPEKVGGDPGRLYHVFAENTSTFPQIGRYCLSVEATERGKVVAQSTIQFGIVSDGIPPRHTHYLVGRKDGRGNPITSSRPVDLGRLNETPTLRDNDYPFEPQHAFNVVNFERFPPFHLPPRFVAVWGSRRFTDEEQFGGPLNRGFTAVSVIRPGQDNLPIPQRTWFHTPDAQIAFINRWYRDDPAQYVDLKAYADYRSAFVSPEHAYKLGWACYESWGGGGYAPYDPGIYGFDEEQMWPDIAVSMLRDHPEALPAALRALKEKDPRAEKSETRQTLTDAYVRAWGDFVGNYYRGARACAAARGRAFRVWHYGSKAPGDLLYVGPDDGKPDPATGKPRGEELGTLWPWFRNGNLVDYAASEYARQIDFFQKDFYYQTLFPQTSSLYIKDSAGKYVLDSQGRRRIRRDVFEESVYTEPVKIGYEDGEVAPVFLKAFLAKGENALYWLNGGHYYKDHGTLVTSKQMIPALRPGNQETWGDAGKLGSRPISPYMAEASSIFTFMMGLEGIYLWDSRGYSGPAGFGNSGDPNTAETLGDMEFIVKGMHRVSQWNSLFEGKYAFIRPARYDDTWNRDQPVIRGILNGRYLALAMTNPYLDVGESQRVEIWYDAPYHAARKPIWSGQVSILARHTHLFQCKLPALPQGASYDPDRLYFHYTCDDGNFHKSFFSTGNYNVPYPY